MLAIWNVEHRASGGESPTGDDVCDAGVCTTGGRNADGDEFWFVHAGTGVCETEFGPIAFAPGDYVVLPKGVTYRIVPETTDNYFLVVESAGEISLVEHTLMG